MNWSRSLAPLALLASLTAGVAKAGVVSGRLVDSSGRPVRNALFDFKSNSGGGGNPPTVIGGSSDANGYFKTTITPDGDYSMTIYPLPPPQSLVVTTQLASVVVSPTQNDLGTQVLEVGAEIRGRVVSSAGVPLVAVTLEFLPASGNQVLGFTNGSSDNSGYFDVSLPYGSCELHLKPGPQPYYGGPGTAPVSESLTVNSSIDMGDVVMPPGYTVTGTIVDAAKGKAVSNADVDFIDTTTGAAIYAPDNKSDRFGRINVIVPAGTYDIHVVPQANDNLSPAVLIGKPVPPTFSLGTVRLDAGFELRGKVVDANKNKIAGAAVRLVDVATGVPVVAAGNVADATGSFRFTVPSGTFDITISAPYSVPFGATLLPGVVVASKVDLHDTELPSVPFPTTEGFGTHGSGGFVPAIGSTGGTARLGNRAFAATCDDVLGHAVGFVSITTGGASSSSGAPRNPGGGSSGGASAGGGFSSDPFHDLVPLRFDGPTGVAGAGGASFALPIDDAMALVGTEVRVQFFVLDPHAIGGVAQSRTLVIEIEQ